MQLEQPVSGVETLPEDAILVHIGPHKTGTTAMQYAFFTAREELLQHGVLYPGSKKSHHDPATALIQLKQGWRATPSSHRR